MICTNCGKDTPLSSVLFCPYCGTKYTEEKAEKKSRIHGRANGTGTAFRRGKTWTARVVLGWKPSPDGSHKIPIWDTKGGFPTKKDALNYCTTLLERAAPKKRERITLKALFDKWEPWYSPRVGASTMAGYKSAFKHYEKLNNRFVDEIIPDDLQKAMDSCPAGKRTHQMMKVIAGLLWAYAKENRHTDEDITENLFTGRGKSIQREPLTPQEEKKIYDSIGKFRYAEYIYCLCYLGYRPGEMLELRKDQLFCEILPKDDENEEIPVWFFVNGKKTDAGKDRIVVVPDEILPYILERLFVPGTDLLFPQYVFSRGKKPKFKKFKFMNHEYFNKRVFKILAQKLGISTKKTPYCARHSYADKLKKASGSDKDKAQLIGHSDYMFTQSHYQSVDLKDLRDLVNSFQ